MTRIRSASAWMMGLNAMLGVGLFLPMLPMLEAQAGMTPLQLGVLAGAFPFAEGLGGLLYPRGLKRIDPKVLMAAGQVLCALSSLAIVFSLDFGVLLLGRLLGGAGAASVVIAQFVIGRESTGPERVHRLGQIGAAQALGFMVGLLATALAALALDGRAAIQAAGAVAMAFGLVSTGLVVAARWTRPPSVDRGRAAWRDLPLVDLALYGCNTFVYITLAILTSIWAGRTPGVGAPGASVIFIALAALSMVFQARVAGFAARRIGSPAAILVGFVILVVGTVVFGLDLLPAVTVIGLVVARLGYSVIVPNALSQILGGLDAKAAEARAGWALVSACLGACAGPVITGAVEERSSLAAAIGVLSAAGLVGVAVAMTRMLRWRVRATPPS